MEGLGVLIPFGRYRFLIEERDRLERMCDNLEVQLALLDEEVCELHIQGLRYRLHHAEDIYLLAELFLAGDYDFEFSSGGDPVVVDVGAHVGLAAVYFAALKGARVYGFEPFPGNCKRALEHIRLNHLEANVTLECFGLAAGDDQRIVEHCSEYAAQMTDQGPHRILNGDFTTEPVPINLRQASVALAPILERHSEAENLVLKIDCEGAEFAILQELGSLVRAFRLILLEWHDQRAPEATQLLLDQGFDCVVRDRSHRRDGLIYAYRRAW